MEEFTQLEVFIGLGLSLALGLLIGLQKEWQAQGWGEKDIASGLRTFGLIGLSGAVSGLIATETSDWALAVGFLGVLLLTVVAYHRHSGKREGIGITTEVALLLTFALGAVVMLGYRVEAAATAVIVAFLLGMKSALHGLVGKIEREELYAALKLLLISVVLLPILPNEGYGPYGGVLNPYEIWWMVVLIAAISFVGYFAMKIGGARHGAVLTGLFGGLASSTATTLTLSRYAAEGGGVKPLASGILAACATMFPRIVAVAYAVNTELGQALMVPFLSMAAITYAASGLLWYRSDKEEGEALELDNPFQLKTALKFGALLVAILLLGKALTSWFDEAGLFLLAGASGITDVDAITLSVSRMTSGDLALGSGVMAILIAATVNSLVKSGMAFSIGGKRLGLYVGVPLVVAVGVGFVLMYVVGGG